MNKTVLFLMNGFGIEQIDSYNVYNSKLMPNLDKYTNTYLFSTLEVNSHDISSGYRTFSTGSDLPLTYTLIDQCMEQYEKSPNMNYFLENVKTDSKIQLFLFAEDEKSLEHIREFIKFIRTKKSNPIYVHLVLTSLDIDNYKEVEKIINKIMYDYKECRLSTVIGQNTLSKANLSTYMNMLKNEIGEKWPEFSKKFASLLSNKTEPINVKDFYINNGFNVSSNDSFFFFNYGQTDLTNFVNEVTKTFNNNNYYSLFKIAGVKYPMYAYPSSGISMVNSLNKIGAKTLIIASKSDVKSINYYCNGLKEEVSDNVFFTSVENFEDQEYIKAIIRDSIYDLIIINYQVDEAKDIPSLNEKLNKLDEILGYIHDFCLERKITLFISSLYGLKKELPIDRFAKAFLNFGDKVPFVVVDSVFRKGAFTVNGGNLHNLAHTIYTNINNKYNGGDVLIKKTSQISKMLKK